MDLKHVMDEWRRAAKELLSEDWSPSQNLGSQQVKTSADSEKIKQITMRGYSGDKVSPITGDKQDFSDYECLNKEQGDYQQIAYCYYYLFAFVVVIL